MIIEQIMTIPANHRLSLDLPENFPEGGAVKITIKAAPQGRPADSKKRKGKYKSSFLNSLGDLYGCLKNSPAFGGDGMEIQRMIREDVWEDSI